jgi:Mrp family chromosome partitioning ATPase
MRKVTEDFVGSEKVSALKETKGFSGRNGRDRRNGQSLPADPPGKGTIEVPGEVPGEPFSPAGLLCALKRARSNRGLLEEVRRLRDFIILSTARDKTQAGVTVALTGPRGKEGTSFLCLLLGLSLGESAPRKVAIMDGRLNAEWFAVLADAFGLSIRSARFSNGMDHVSGYFNPACPNVHFLQSSKALDTVDFFSDEGLTEFLSEARSRFQFTIIDLPPLLREPSGSLVLPFVDRLYLVVEAGKTSRADLSRCDRAAREAGGQVRGVIINKQRTPFWARFFCRERFL